MLPAETPRLVHSKGLTLTFDRLNWKSFVWWICWDGGTIFLGLHQWQSLPPDIGSAEKRAATSPRWSKMRSWDRTETGTGPHPTLPIRKLGTRRGDIKVKNAKNDGHRIGFVMSKTLDANPSHASWLNLFPSLVRLLSEMGWLAFWRVCPALTIYSVLILFLQVPVSSNHLTHCFSNIVFRELFCFLSDWLFLTLSLVRCHY